MNIKLPAFAAKCHEDYNQYHKDYQMTFGAEIPFVIPLGGIDPEELLKILGLDIENFDASKMSIAQIREYMITTVLSPDAFMKKEQLELLGASFLLEEYIKWLNFIALPVKSIEKIEVVFPDATDFSDDGNDLDPVFKIDNDEWKLSQVLWMVSIDLESFRDMPLNTFESLKATYADHGYYSRYEWIQDVLIFAKKHCCQLEQHTAN